MHRRRTDAVLGTDCEVRDIPDEWKHFISLERAANVIRERASEAIPGLLQSPLYIRTIYRRHEPGAPDEHIEEKVAARASRLDALHRSPTLYFVIDERTLRQVIGSPEIMVDQLDHLLSLSVRPLIHISVVPQFAPGRPLIQGAFRVMTLEASRQVAHVEHCFGETVVSKPQQIQQLLTWFGDLQAEALPPSASIELMKQIRKEHSNV